MHLISHVPARLLVVAALSALAVGGCDKEQASDSRGVAAGEEPAAEAPPSDPSKFETVELDEDELPEGDAVDVEQVDTELAALARADEGQLCVGHVLAKQNRITAHDATHGYCSGPGGHARLLRLSDGDVLAESKNFRQASERLGFLVAYSRDDYRWVLVRASDGKIFGPTLADHRKVEWAIPQDSPYFWAFARRKDGKKYDYEALDEAPEELSSLVHVADYVPSQGRDAVYDAERDALIWPGSSRSGCGGFIATRSGEGGCLFLVDKEKKGWMRRRGDWWIRAEQNSHGVTVFPPGEAEPFSPVPGDCGRLYLTHLPNEIAEPRLLFKCQQGGSPRDSEIFGWSPARRWKVPGGGWHTRQVYDLLVDLWRPGGMMLGQDDRRLFDLRDGKLYEVPAGMRRISSMLYAKGADLWVLDHDKVELRKLAHTHCAGKLDATLDTTDVQGVVCLSSGRSHADPAGVCTENTAGSPFDHAYVFDLDHGTRQRVDAVPVARTKDYVVLTKSPFLYSNRTPCMQRALFTIRRSAR